MAGPTSMRNHRGGTVRGRDVGVPSASFHVSCEATSRNITTSKPARTLDLHQPQAVRPSTSGGIPSGRKTMDKRETRDDLHFHPLRPNQVDTTYFNFPLPSSLSTPAATPRSSPPRMYGPEYPEPEIVDSHYTHTRMGIGMALGSPTQQPVVWSPQIQFQEAARQESPESMADWKNTALPPKPKLSKWKILGGLFGKKTVGSTTAFYEVQAEVQTVHETDYVTFPSPPATDRPRGRARTSSERKLKKHKPDVKRANTVPMDFQSQKQAARPRQFNLTPEIQLDGGPILNVDIPSIEMERYSVMFGNLVKPASSTSSLLARRQATLEKLKVVNEAIAEHERQQAEAKSKLLRPRRATSPQPTKSPAISLFPAPSRMRRDGSLPFPKGASTLQRSNTSPAALSPNRQTFEPHRPHYEEHTIMLAPTPPISKPSATLTSPWSADESHLALDSPSSAVSIEEVHDSAPLKPRLAEPTWEMVPPAATSDDAVKVKPLKLTPPPPQSRSTPPSRKQSLQSSLDALVQAGTEDEAENLIKTAAEVSIARQISMSRRQKQSLVPIRTRIVNATLAANAGYAGVTKKDPAGVERLFMSETKPMTPTLVNIVAGRVVKSERAVFESG